MQITIVLCTYNRQRSLFHALQSLSELEIDAALEYEIVAVDNNSSDQTKGTVESFIKKNSHVRYVFEPKQGISNARNAGIANAKGEIILFVDDDVIIDPKMLTNIMHFTKEHDFDAIGGRVLPLYSPQTPQWIKDCRDILSGPIVCHDYGDKIKLYDQTMFPFIGAMMVVKKNVFEELGGFKPELGVGSGLLGEDTEFFIRIRNAGKKIYYNPDLLVWHPVEKSRVRLFYVARWSFMAGRYMAIQNTMTEDKGLIYYWGIPRYLFPRTLKNLGSFLLTIGNRKEFIKSLRNLFINFGMLSGYHQLGQLNTHVKRTS